MFDKHGDIRFLCIFEWMLPKFGDGKHMFYECLAARMQNNMLLCIRTMRHILKYYSPANRKCIQSNDVTLFFAVSLPEVFRELHQSSDVGQCVSCLMGTGHA
jgi:hypothetical protein